MSTKRSTFGTRNERCGVCGRATPHDIRIEIRTESRELENAQFSREPYRVSTCRFCGETDTLRMNNA